MCVGTFQRLRGKAFAAALLITAAFVPFGATGASAETTWEKIEKAGVIKYANGSNYPPMEFMQDGKNVGFNVDMGEEIARRLGLKAEWVIVEFKGIIGTLKSERADVINGSMTITMDRAKQVTFTRGYVDFGISCLHRKEDPISKREDAAGKIVGVEVGTAGERWARDNLKDVKEIKVYEQLLLAIKDLAFGRVDLVVNNRPALGYSMGLIGTGGKPLALCDVWDQKVAGLAVRHGDGELLVKLNEAIDSMERDGFLKKLREKWLGE
ncbi:MAG: ABC transporter substrate-binding protein [Hyphomicrobiales bacterium]